MSRKLVTSQTVGGGYTQFEFEILSPNGKSKMSFQAQLYLQTME